MKDHPLGWIGALDEEIEFLSKESAEQDLALTSGTRDPNATGPGGLYVFLMADALRLPEDAAGTLRDGDIEVSAMGWWPTRGTLSVVNCFGGNCASCVRARWRMPE